MKCPDCKQVLPDVSVACRCGWKKGGESGRPFVHCAHETCNLRAIVKQKTPTGWANFCEPHYVRFHDDIARKRFTELGLDMLQDETKEEWRKRVFAYIRGKTKLKTFEDAVDLDEAA